MYCVTSKIFLRPRVPHAHWEGTQPNILLGADPPGCFSPASLVNFLIARSCHLCRVPLAASCPRFHDPWVYRPDGPQLFPAELPRPGLLFFQLFSPFFSGNPNSTPPLPHIITFVFNSLYRRVRGLIWISLLRLTSSL